MNNGKIKAVLVAAVLAVSGWLFTGCGAQAQQEHKSAMVVGIVHVDRVLPELPEYRQYSEAYQTEREALFKGLKQPNDPRALQSFLDSDKKQEIQKSVQKWDEKKRKFLDETMDKIRAASETVSKEKNIDIVIMNAPWYPVSERMALDITTDIIITLKESGKTVH